MYFNNHIKFKIMSKSNSRRPKPLANKSGVTRNGKRIYSKGGKVKSCGK